MARASHQPTAESRAEVKALASFGVTEDEIAKYVGVTGKTLRKHYRRELDTAHIAANAQVARRLFQHATGDSVPAAIFWMKARGGWREKQELEHSGSVNVHLDATDSAL